MNATPTSDFLDSRDIQYEIKPHDQPAYTCETAAAARGVRVSQIVKCMIGQDENGKLIVMLIPGHKSLKSSKARKHIQAKRLDLVAPADLEELGLTVGAISPTQLIGTSRILMDPSVLDEKIVDISSGHPLAGVELSSVELQRVLAAEMVEMVSLNT
ncbi:MAG: aminoacyl-tRNA deacylase [Nocardioides sp.]